MKFRGIRSMRIFPSTTRRRRLGTEQGNILVYIVMIMVIFALLGATMVSLFSTSIGSSATANESRRAFYLAESGIRYGLSELRKANGFSTLNIATLNDTMYKMPPSGDFDITIFGAWFKSLTYQSVSTSGTISLEVEKGKIPDLFFEKNLTPVIPDLYIVNVGSELTFSDAAAKVTGFSDPSDTSFKVSVSDNFKIYEKTSLAPNTGTICLAVKPFNETDSFTPSGDPGASLDLERTALNIFPKTDGCFLLRGIPYFYKTAKDDGTRFTLYNISLKKGITPSSVAVNKITDYIILAPNNYFITSKGSSGTVTYGGDLDNAVALYDHSSPPLTADLQLTLPYMQQIETDGSYISDGVDAKGNYYMQIGGVAGSNLGAMWFKETVNFGGSNDYCTTGECDFKSGIRAFFTLEYSGSGDGLMFALFNGVLNGTGSIGGDADLTELLGYGGDSRDSLGNFLDPNRGIKPPKLGLEFDTKRNWDPNFEKKPVDFCDDDQINGKLRQNTRNDPDPPPSSGEKDYVQYVYWGANSVNAPCRGTGLVAASYDDNRHDPAAAGTDDWFKDISGVVDTSPAITADGKKIYVSSNNTDINPISGRLYAFELDADGYPKPGWNSPLLTNNSGGVTSPVLGSDGTVYVGAGTRLYAINPDKTIKFSFPTSGTVRTPTIGGDGTIYVTANGTIGALKFGYIYAVNSDGSLKTGWLNVGGNPQTFTSSGPTPLFNAPVMSKDKSIDKSLVFVTSKEGYIYAFKASDGSYQSRKPGLAINTAAGIGPSDGTVYVGTNDHKVYGYAVSGTDLSIDPSWQTLFLASGHYSSSPVIGEDGTVYVGNYDDNLYAIKPDGTQKWIYPAAGNVQSTPFIDSNNTIYFGSDIRDPSIDRRNIYALYSDGTEKWRFETAGDVRGTPIVKGDGSVYIGSFDYKFYAINQFATPKSLKNKSITSTPFGADVKIGDIPLSVDSSDNWLLGKTVTENSESKILPWAVRMEVYRSINPNITDPQGYYRYELRSWIRQCTKSDCSDVLGTFYEDTRVEYYPDYGALQDQRLPQMEQSVFLSPGQNGEHEYFTTFLFGFSSQTASNETQTSTIRNFKLSFVRPTDPTVRCDPNWPAGTICP